MPEKQTPPEGLEKALERALNYEGIDARAEMADHYLAERLLEAPPMQAWMAAQREEWLERVNRALLRYDRGVYDVRAVAAYLTGAEPAEEHAVEEKAAPEKGAEGPRQPVEVHCLVHVPRQAVEARAALAVTPPDAVLALQEGQQTLLGGIFGPDRRVVATWTEQR